MINEHGRFVCTKDDPWTKEKHAGRVVHPDAKCVGECYEGCCDDYRCPNCGATWRVEGGYA